MPRLFGVALGLLLAGCSVSVATDLDEAHADRVVAALDARGIAAEKISSRGVPGSFRVNVASDDAPSAVQALIEEEPKPARAPGLLDALSTGALVPSREAEHARLLAGTASDLERTLEAVDGVASASVHLAEPFDDPLDADAPSPKKSAAVLLRYRGKSPPIAAGDVARVVAGSLPGLAVDRVSVVAVPLEVRAPPDVVHLGPVSTTHASARTLRWIGAAIALSNVLFMGLVVFLWLRLRSLRNTSADDGDLR